jgi:rhodanese-related sulfurtransferase
MWFFLDAITKPPHRAERSKERVSNDAVRRCISGGGSMSETQTINVATARSWLGDGGEIAFLDLREEGQHCDGHPLLAVNAPYSRLELDILRWCRANRPGSCSSTAMTASPRARRGGSPISATAMSSLTGGVAAWSMAGYPLFPSSNVPSKGFAEVVEIDSHTPHVTAAELAEMQRAGAKLKILDSRTVEEFNRFHVPGAQTCPGAELVYRFADLVPDPEPWSSSPAPAARAASSARNR